MTGFRVAAAQHLAEAAKLINEYGWEPGGFPPNPCGVIEAVCSVAGEGEGWVEALDAFATHVGEPVGVWEGKAWRRQDKVVEAMVVAAVHIEMGDIPVRSGS